MTGTTTSPDIQRRGGAGRQRRLPRAFRGSPAAVVVVLLVLTLPWPGSSGDVHAVRTELADARADLRAAVDGVGQQAPEAFGAGAAGGLTRPGRVGDRHAAMAATAHARNAERRVREAEAELEVLLAGARDGSPLARLAAQVRSLVHAPRDSRTAGRLRAPVQGVVTSGFGPRALPSWDGGTMHDGIDIFAPSGTPVRSAAGGYVSFAGYRPESGTSVAVDHGLDAEGRLLQTVYSHLSSVDVEAGQRLRGGEVLGAVGNTGTHSTGPHLHFEVRLEGQSVDPRAWL